MIPNQPIEEVLERAINIGGIVLNALAIEHFIVRHSSEPQIDDHEVMVQEGRLLLDYVTMNAIAIQKILKKYAKVHGSVTGRNFKTEMHDKRIELLQSP
ncbi:uncharacterized protein A4U43_C01F13630 [Asparagus officinalis]|uniref:Uncharacterized protein n=1 Tax=Asparagus officinalis TaxID=4686 RepID=A0A5P1FP39_ASPOF|nr:uncharacterized protein A4U43_C01F13630 [Asparagus officinalis]